MPSPSSARALRRRRRRHRIDGADVVATTGFVAGDRRDRAPRSLSARRCAIAGDHVGVSGTTTDTTGPWVRRASSCRSAGPSPAVEVERRSPPRPRSRCATGRCDPVEQVNVVRPHPTIACDEHPSAVGRDMPRPRLGVDAVGPHHRVVAPDRRRAVVDERCGGTRRPPDTGCRGNPTRPAPMRRCTPGSSGISSATASRGRTRATRNAEFSVTAFADAQGDQFAVGRRLEPVDRHGGVDRTGGRIEQHDRRRAVVERAQHQHVLLRPGLRS